MHRGLPAAYFDQCWMSGDKAENFTGAQKQGAPPPAVVNTPAIEVADEISIQQVTAGSESAHHLVSSTTYIAPAPQGAEDICNHDQVEWAGYWI